MAEREPSVQAAERRWSEHQETMRRYLRGNPELAAAL